jgi:hypothetical protein
MPLKLLNMWMFENVVSRTSVHNTDTTLEKNKKILFELLS